MSINVTTKERVKESAEISGTSLDTTIDNFIGMVSHQFENEMDRWLESISRTEYFDIESGGTVISLKGFPISTVTSVSYDILRAWGSGSVIPSADYFVDTTNGLIVFQHGKFLIGGPDVLKIVYNGGMAATLGAFVTAFPDIARLADLQVTYLLKRRKQIGETTAAVGGHSVSFQTETMEGFQKGVREGLRPYKRMAHVAR